MTDHPADVLDRVMLLPSVFVEWQKQCRLFAATLDTKSVSEIPDELAYAKQDGTLELSVTVGERKLSMIVNQADWSWVS